MRPVRGTHAPPQPSSATNYAFPSHYHTRAPFLYTTTLVRRGSMGDERGVTGGCCWHSRPW
eukprot:8674826-Pyramimonas_sp.AAC.1